MTAKVTIFVNGRALQCRERMSVAAVLLEAEAGARFHFSRRLHEPRSLFCGMGICFECLVTVDGRPERRGCMIQVRDGMRIELP
jgi:predicted molibdopterin-dependent oxidoreductase YjgC